MRALIVLTHSECKRLIAKGLKEHPGVQHAKENGRIFISRGSTTAYVLEELTGESFEKNHYVAGQMTGDKQNLYRYGGLKVEKRLKEVVLEKGVKREIESLQDELKKFEPGDIIFKGGNTLGTDGIAGVYVAHPEGGTIGGILPHAISRGIDVIVPISLSRTIDDSVWELSQILGSKTVDPEYCMGLPIGIMPIPGEVFTELEAFDILYPDVNIFHIGSGGVGDGEGSLHFFLVGEDVDVKQAYSEIVELIRSEEPYIPDVD
jgi:hypothetical protein